ncbi:MAG: ATP-binding protein [Saprospiraceae bacterium]
MRILITLSLLMVLSIVGFGQRTPRVDSILIEVENAPDEEKLDVWLEWFHNTEEEDSPFVLKMIDRAYMDAVDIIGQDSAEIWKANVQSINLLRFREYGKVMLRIQILDKMKSSADSLSRIEGSPHKNLALWYYLMGYFLYMQADVVKSEEYFIKSIKLSKVMHLNERLFIAYNALSFLKTFTADYEKAIKYGDLAESLIDNTSISIAEKYKFYYGKAYLHEEMGQSELARDYLSIVIDNLDVFNNKLLSFRIQTDYARNLCNLRRVNEGIQFFEKLKPIFEEEGNIGTMEEFSKGYGDALMLAGRYKEGKEWFEKSRMYYDKIQEARRKDEVQEWQAKYEANEKEAKIQLLEQQQQNTQSRLINLTLIGLVTIGFLSFLIYRNRNQKKQLALQIERDREIAINRDRLFSSITHDIRTPLSLMLAPLERAENKISDESAISDIQLARRNGKRLMELFNQILDWNKAEAKALRLNSQVGQLDFTFDVLIKRFEQQANEKEVGFSQNVKMPKGQFLLDYDKLDKILSNLIGNAIKFCEPKEGVQLEAKVEEIESNYCLSLVISDQGPGIAASEKENLFQRFVQGEQGKLKGGTGIGLALVKELVDMMKGEIELHSEKGKGATFTVKLPIELVNELPVESFQEQEMLLVNQDSKGNRKPTLLIVEDEPELLNFLKTALSDNFEVEIANSTTAGLNVAINRIPEIIISDWTLPDNNGGWFCQQIAANELTAHIPILILTAHSSDLNQKEALDSGAVAWMNKPFDLGILKKQLNTILLQQQRVQKNWTNKILPENFTDKEEIIDVDPFIQKVLNDIGSNYQDDQFSVEKLANSLFLSRTQLYRKVKNITGRGPSKLIIEFRLKRARQLLKQSELSIANVAYQVGFSDPNYFGKAYKEYFKTTPSQDMTKR